MKLRVAILAVFAAALGLVAYAFRNPGVPADSHWCPVLVGVDFYPGYVAAQALVAGLGIYDNHRARGGNFVDPVQDHEGVVSRFMYPPPVAYLYLPLSRLSAATAWRIWLAVSVVAMTLALALLMRLGGGDAWFSLALAAGLLAFYPLHFALLNGNVGWACLTLWIAGLYFLVAGRSETLAALCIALAAALKLYPALLLPWFAIQRRWALLAKTVAFLLAIAALTAGGGAWVVFPGRAQDFDRFVQAWYANGSLFSLLANVTELQVAFPAARIFALAELGFALAWVRQRRDDRLGLLYQCGLLSAAMILAPNTVYDYNLIFAIPGLAAVLHDLLAGPGGGRSPLLLAAAALAALAVPTRLVFNAAHQWGATVPAGNLAATKFPWLLALFAALAWRYRQLETRKSSLLSNT